MSDSNSITGASKDTPVTRSPVPTPVYTSHTCCCIENNYCGCPKDFCDSRNVSNKSLICINICGITYSFLFSGIIGCMLCTYSVAPVYGVISPAVWCCVCYSYKGYHELNCCQKTGCLCCRKTCCTDSYGLIPCLCCDKPCCHWHCTCKYRS
jgi:hypothetical protein